MRACSQIRKKLSIVVRLAENDRAVLQYLYPLTAELFQGDSLELDERVEPDIDAVFEYEFVIGRFFGDGRSRLRY